MIAVNIRYQDQVWRPLKALTAADRIDENPLPIPLHCERRVIEGLDLNIAFVGRNAIHCWPLRSENYERKARCRGGKQRANPGRKMMSHTRDFREFADVTQGAGRTHQQLTHPPYEGK